MKLSSLTLILTSLFLITSCTTEKKEDTGYEKFQLDAPEVMGMNSDSLAKIDEMVMEFVYANKYPGAVTLVARKGKIVYESEVGWSDTAKTIPYRKDHLFRMASMTKPIVSVAAMQLVETGQIRLDDPVGKYIPSFNETELLTEFNPEDTTWTSKPTKTIPTVRQLLTHTAGVPYGFMNPPVNGAILAKHGIPELSTHLDITIEEAMNKIGDLPLMHEPGAQWMYGLNTDVLGRVVEVASGQLLDDYIREHITEPLGIEYLDFYFDDSLNKNLTDLYLPQPDSTLALAVGADYPVNGTKTYLSGGAGMTGTARDYFLFCQAILNDGELGGARILNAETAQSMHIDQIDTITYPWGPARFGFGFDISDGHPVRPDGTYSWGGAFSTTFWIDPVNDLVVVQLRQVLFSPFDQEINSALEQIVYGAIME